MACNKPNLLPNQLIYGAVYDSKLGNIYIYIHTHTHTHTHKRLVRNS